MMLLAREVLPEWVQDASGVHKGMWMTECFKRDIDDAEGIKSCL